MDGTIKKVHAREIFDTRNLPALEVDVLLEDGSMGRASAPTGTSKGANEAFELRDGDSSYYNGMGVQKAVNNVNTEIARVLIGEDATDQERIDRLMIELDGTKNKSRLGGNAIIATSIANVKAAAKSMDVPLFEHLGGGREMPIPLIHVMIGGPVYAGADYGSCDFQEFAYHALNARSYKEGFTATYSVYDALCDILRKEKGYALPRLEGGTLSPRFASNMEAFSVLTKAIENAGYVPGKDFGVYVDIASSHFYRNGAYHLKADGRVASQEEMIDTLMEIRDAFPVISMEDCLHEEDWDGWKTLTKMLGDRTQLVGDDLFTTNPQRIKKGIEIGAANAIVIKPNQVGTVTETIETIRIAKAAGYGTIVSGRSGEIGDPFLSHLLVGQSLGQGKVTGFFGKEHIRLNELLRIEEYLGDRASYAGSRILSRFLQ